MVLSNYNFSQVKQKRKSQRKIKYLHIYFKKIFLITLLNKRRTKIEDKRGKEKDLLPLWLFCFSAFFEPFFLCFDVNFVLLKGFAYMNIRIRIINSTQYVLFSFLIFATTLDQKEIPFHYKTDISFEKKGCCADKSDSNTLSLYIFFFKFMIIQFQCKY